MTHLFHRSGFMHFFHKQEILAKIWDKDAEDVSEEEVSDETIQCLKENILNLDSHMAPYPYEIWQKWKLLCSQITGKDEIYILLLIILTKLTNLVNYMPIKSSRIRT